MKLFNIKISFFLSFFLVISADYTAKSQIEMTCDGKVGVGPLWGVTPNKTLYVNGEASFTCYPAQSGLYFQNYHNLQGSTWYDEPGIIPQWNLSTWLGNSSSKLWCIYSRTVFTETGTCSQYSDASIKENIKPITGALDAVMGLKGRRYDLKADHYKNIKDENKLALLMEQRKNKIGFIAQEVKEVIPEAVGYDDMEGLYYLQPGLIVPYLTEAIKEQQAIIEDLQNQIADIQANCCSNMKSTSIDGDLGGVEQLHNEIYQNTPNPFTVNTNIRYFLRDDAVEAQICIYNMNGKQLKSFRISDRGEGSINVNGGVLTAGMYTYALIADGQVVGTKKMVLTD